MIDMLQNAKDLIAKGKILGDPELVQMGMDLLEQYSPTEKTMARGLGSEASVDEFAPIYEPAGPMYICNNCNYEMVFDKPGRKRCPECKKHKLILVEPTLEIVDSPLVNPNRVTEDDFRTQVRGQKSDRVHYDDQGNPDGMIRRSEQVEGMTNIWEDDGVEEQDATNELLKKITKVTPRTRKPPKLVTLKCENCQTIEHVHPIHAVGKSRYLCSKCIRRRSQH